MEIRFFGVDNNCVHIEDKGKEVVGIYSKSPNGKHIVVFSKHSKSEPNKYNFGVVNNKQLIKVGRVNRPTSAIITDDGTVAIALIADDETMAMSLEFYDPSGKKIKTLKGYGQTLYLSPDSKFLIWQAFNIKDDSDRDRELCVYDMTTLKKIITTTNPLWEKRVSFDTKKQTVTFERDDDTTASWISATLSLKINK